MQDPAAAQRHLKQPEIMAKIQKLVKAGMLPAPCHLAPLHTHVHAPTPPHVLQKLVARILVLRIMLEAHRPCSNRIVHRVLVLVGKISQRQFMLSQGSSLPHGSPHAVQAS